MWRNLSEENRNRIKLCELKAKFAANDGQRWSKDPRPPVSRMYRNAEEESGRGGGRESIFPLSGDPN